MDNFKNSHICYKAILDYLTNIDGMRENVKLPIAKTLYETDITNYMPKDYSED
jgi:hypothetical protein